MNFNKRVRLGDDCIDIFNIGLRQKENENMYGIVGLGLRSEISWPLFEGSF